MIWNRKQKQ